MPRPISWIPRLHDIRRAVVNSVRSHYDRKDIEQLFQLQPRAAQKLLEALPSVAVGTSRLVERETLCLFLDRVHAAGHASTVVQEYRSGKAAASRRRLRHLVQRNAEPASVQSLPSGLNLERGRVEIHFESTAQLAEAMYFLARLLEAEGDKFAEDFEPRRRMIQSPMDDAAGMFADLHRLEQRER